MKRSIDFKDVSKSKSDNIKSGPTKNSQLWYESKSKKIIELKSNKSNEPKPKPALPETRKEEKIIQKKQKVQYLDKYQYHKSKDIKDKNPNRVSIVTHQRLGAIGVLHEEANFQKQTMTDSWRGTRINSQKLTKAITSTDAKDSTTKTLTQSSNRVSQALVAQSREMIKEAKKYSSNNNLKNDSKKKPQEPKLLDLHL